MGWFQGKSLVEILRCYAYQSPDRIACCFWTEKGGSNSITWGGLWSKSLSFAAYLERAGATPGDPFIIVLTHRPEVVYAFFGAMIAGMVPTIMPFPSSKQDAALFWSAHRSLFELIGAGQFLTYRSNQELANLVPHFAIVRYVEDIAYWFDGREETTPALPAEEAIALLQHTSGTTGLKKGVMLSHKAILNQVQAYSAKLDFDENDIVPSWLPLYHDMGLIACLVMPLMKRARLILLDPFEWVAKPTILLDCVQSSRATFCWLPNFAFSHLVRTAPPGYNWDLSSIKGFINCSEPCKAVTMEQFRNRFSKSGLRPTALQVCYAMAENVFAVTQTEICHILPVLDVDKEALEVDSKIRPPSSGRAISLLSCGKPLDGTVLVILAPDNRVLGPCEVGEIALVSSCLFRGYNKLPKATADKLRNGMYHTGDLGFVADGELFVTGRKDDLMIVYGRNFYAHSVEQVASECPGVVPGRVVAFTVENEASGSRDAVMLIEGDGTYPEAELRRLVKRKVSDHLGLALYAVRVFNRGTLVKSTAGKISRHQNRHLYLEQSSAT